ncbi:MAG: NUDIX domain-containing protein [Hyphomicrobiaceae bacterium]
MPRMCLGDGSWRAITAFDLRVSPGSWSFARENAAEIARHWEQRKRTNPNIFNGIIHVLVSHYIDSTIFSGRYCRTDFASYIYWRDTVLQARKRPGGAAALEMTCDGFVVVIVRAHDDQILMASAAQHTLNAGFDVVPGGFIDPSDISPTGHIDPVAAGMRELHEETGLEWPRVTMDREAWVACDGPLIAIGLVCRLVEPDKDVLQMVQDHCSQQALPELSNPYWIPPARALQNSRLPRFLALLLKGVVSGRGGREEKPSNP